MSTFVVTLPAEPAARDAALQALRDWQAMRRAEIRGRFILDADRLLFDATDPAHRALSAAVEVAPAPRTTRWALLCRTRRSARLGDAAEVVVLDPNEKPRVLGIGRDDRAVVTLRMPATRLEAPRVGKLDHPALLWTLARAVERDEYWPATAEAHAEATALAERLRQGWPGSGGAGS